MTGRDTLASVIHHTEKLESPARLSFLKIHMCEFGGRSSCSYLKPLV